MKILLPAICVLFLFSGMTNSAKHTYTLNCFPLADTMIAGLCNTIQVLEDGKPARCDRHHIDFVMNNGSYYYVGKGKYNVNVVDPKKGTQVWIGRYGVSLANKNFYTRPK
jgi:hypothetical protein